jgi:hypothetical protein
VFVTGKISPLSEPGGKRTISKSAEPNSFWLMAGLYAVPGGVSLFMSLRRRK